MRSRVVFMAALLAATAASPAAADVPPSGDVALYWGQVAAATMPSTPGNGGPVATSRTLAMVGVGIRDAVNASLGNPQPSYLGVAPATGADTRAAASVAAHNLLVTLNPANSAVYDAALVASLAQIPDGQAKFDGQLLGGAVATAMITRRTGDGSTKPSTYVPTGQIGHWRPTPPGNLPPAAPQWGGVDPWLMTSGDQFKPLTGPPALDSAAYAAAFNEVKEIGSATSLTRTADQSAAAQFWATPVASGVQPWLLTAVKMAEAKGSSTLENANMLALVSVSVADAVIATFNTKYAPEFDFWRPVTAIRMADLDGNPGTDVDAGWTSFITTPNHPSFSSGHSAVAAAAGTVLADIFGDNAAFCLDSGPLQRCFTSFSGAAQDAANSRLWGGIHWRFDNEAGLEIGRQVAEFQLGKTYFNAIPEPSAWLMMIAGFGLAGAVARRRKVKVAYAVGMTNG